MILPIVAYGDPVLKKEAEVLTKEYPDLELLIANMFETMYAASGVGLAAPQIGKSIRLFVIDGSPFAEDDEEDDEVEPDPRAVGMEGLNRTLAKSGGFKKVVFRFQKSEKKFTVMKKSRSRI